MHLLITLPFKSSESLQHPEVLASRPCSERHSKSCGTVCGRYGVWGDWEQPYLTLNAEYEAAQLRVFARMVANGHIYRGRKPVHWSPSSRTALAEAVQLQSLIAKQDI